jgi:hypothetical protein
MIVPFKKLNQSGFDHVFLVAVVVVVSGIGGTYYFINTHAESAPWTGGLELSSTAAGGNCMQADAETTGSYVGLAKCSNTITQKWLKEANGTWNGDAEFTIETDHAGSFQCLDDQGTTTTSPTHKNWVQLDPCSSAGTASDFVWWGTDHQLKNRASGLCIDDYRNNTKATQLDFYTCKSTGPSNQNWFEVANSASPTAKTGTPTPVSTGGSGNGGGTTTAKLVKSSNDTGALALANLTNSRGVHMCVDDYQGLATNNTKVDAYQCNGLTSQTWSLADPTVSGSIATVEVRIHGNMCLEVNQNKTAANTPIGIYTCSGTAGQKWEAGTSEPFELKNPNSGLCLTDPSSSKTNGTQFVTYKCTGTSG